MLFFRYFFFSVVTHLWYGGMFHNEFIANLPLSLIVKEFWKSVNIWRSYRQKYSGMFFWLTVYIRKYNINCIIFPYLISKDVYVTSSQYRHCRPTYLPNTGAIIPWPVAAWICVSQTFEIAPTGACNVELPSISLNDGTYSFIFML